MPISKKRFGTEEQQYKILEAVEMYNENIELLGKSLWEGMKKLDEHADDMLEKLVPLKKECNKLKKWCNKLMKLVGMNKE